MQILAADCSPTAPLADQEFQVIGKNLDSAELNATLPCFDFVSMSSFNVDVDINWTAIGEPIRESGNSHFRTPGFIVNSRFTGTSRSAEAMGSVSDGATNFTPDPFFGSIFSAKSGTVTID